MTVSFTPRLKLAKQTYGDLSWNTALDAGFDSADLRLLTTGSGSPVGTVEGFYVGHRYLQTDLNPPRLWLCTAPGTPGTWQALPAVANNIPFLLAESGGTQRAGLFMSATNQINIGAGNNAVLFKIPNFGSLIVDYGSGVKQVWHAGNQGAGSGLDADLLDGLQGSNYLSLSGANFVEVSNIALTLPGSNTIAHGFGTVPRVYAAHLVCIGSNNDYVAGDEIVIDQDSYNDGPIITGSTLWANSLNVGVSWLTAAGILLVRRNGGGVPFQLGSFAANWRLRLRAWK